MKDVCKMKNLTREEKRCKVSMYVNQM